MKRISIILFILLFTQSLKAQYFHDLNYPIPAPEDCIEKNRIIEQKLFDYHISNSGKSDSALIVTINYTYDANWRIIAAKATWPGEKDSSKSVITYYPSGHMHKIIEVARHKEHGPIIIITHPNVEFEFDAKGNLINRYIYPNDTTSLETTKYVYNDQNKVIKVLSSYNAIALHLLQEVKYDDRGREIERVYYGGPQGMEKAAYSYLYSYDDERNSKTRFYIKDGIQHVVYEETFNKNGQPVKVQYYPGYYPDLETDRVSKIIYNDDGTVNTQLGYRNNKLMGMRKIVYKKADN